jgi:hypothetical protein
MIYILNKLLRTKLFTYQLLPLILCNSLIYSLDKNNFTK